MFRRFLVPVLLLAAAPAWAPAWADDSQVLRLACRADNAALLPTPLAFSIDFSTGRANETTSGEEFGITAYRDGIGLWEAATGPSAVVYRIDRVKGRFARVDKQIRLDGSCEKVDRKF